MLIDIAHAATEAAHTVTEAATAVAADPTAPQAGGIGAIGLDWKALLFQVINFAVLLAVLRFFAYKPILKVLEARRRKIEEGLKSATEMEQAKAQLAVEARRQRAQLEAHAESVMAAARQRADELAKAAEMKAVANTERLLAEAQAKIERDVAAVKHELKRDVVELVALATERIVDIKLDPKRDADLIEQAIAAVEKGERAT
jgi:F-type H+-transporting ATPase subunit b